MKRDRTQGHSRRLSHILLWSLTATLTAPAQAMPDIMVDGTTSTTLLPGSGTDCSGSCLIDGVTSSGPNLFHSFSRFNVATGATVTFRNVGGFTRILSRVTGTDPSNISGRLRISGSRADLFLLNPNGIIFGPNAELVNINSFVASTADSILFPGSIEFSAREPTPIVLTMNVPIGLQFGATSPGNIQVNPGSPALAPAIAKTLALVGGNINITARTLRATRGRVELGSVGPNSQVSLSPLPANNGFVLGYGSVQSFQDIQLSQEASIQALGGNIQIQGRNITATGGSSIDIASIFGQTGERLKIVASDSIHLSGESNLVPTQLLAQTDGVDRPGGTIQLTTNHLRVEDGAQIRTSTRGSQSGGNIVVEANTIEVRGIGSKPSGLFSESLVADFTGNAGNILLNSNILSVGGGARISASTESQGAGGNLIVNAANVDVSGIAAGSPSRLETATFGAGPAGNLEIAADRFIVRDSGQVTVSSQDRNTPQPGPAGNLAIIANQVELDNQGQIRAETESARGGNIDLRSSILRLSNNSRLSASTQNGQAGNLDINVSAATQLFSNSRLSSEATGNGTAGNIRMATPQLIVQDVAQATVSSAGTGNAGDLEISGKQVTLQAGAKLTAETVSGQGGNIRLQELTGLALSNNSQISAATVDGQGGTVSATVAGDVTLRSGSSLLATATGNGSAGGIDLTTFSNLSLDNSHVSSASAGQGAAGNVNLKTLGELILNRDSRISSESAGSGTAGSVQLFVNGDLNVRNGSQVTVSSTGTGNAGSLEAEARNIFLTNRGQLIATTAGGEGGNINLKVKENIILRFNSEISTEARGTGNGGNIRLEAGGFILGVLSENSDIVANAFQGRGGNIFARAEGIFGFRLFQGQRTPESDFVASSALGIDGSITLDIRDLQADEPLPDGFSGNDIRQGCQPNRSAATGQWSESRLVNIGRGGIPTEPTQTLAASSIPLTWIEDQQDNPQQADPEQSTPPRIVEAQRWVRLANGNLLLTACH